MYVPPNYQSTAKPSPHPQAPLASNDFFDTLKSPPKDNNSNDKVILYFPYLNEILGLHALTKAPTESSPSFNSAENSA